MEFRTVFASLSAVMLGTFLVVFALIFENAFSLAVSETLPLMVLSAIAEETQSRRRCKIAVIGRYAKGHSH